MPSLDLHGEDKIGARIKVKEFIDEQYKLENLEIAVVHGIGQGILKKEVFDILKENKKVEKYNLDCFNSGCTLVRLKKRS